jgi:hypothetical protein
MSITSRIFGQTNSTMYLGGDINGYTLNSSAQMAYRSGSLSNWIITLPAAATNGSAGFLFTASTGFSPKWAPGAGATFNSQQTCYANGGNGTYSQTSGKYYTFIVGDVSSGTNTYDFVFETSATPVTVTAVTRSSTGIIAGQAAVITATTSAVLPTGQGVFLRYSTNAFSTSTVVNMTGSGTSYTASIPAVTNIAGANVAYYVFTSGGTAVPGFPDGATINLNNNGGSNYSYIVASAYCTPSSSSVSTYVSNFQITSAITTINNTSTYSATGYGNYSATISASQYAGNTVGYSVTIQGGTAGIGIFVDWNQNGVFTDVGENVWNSGTYESSNIAYTGTFTVPSGALLGNTRMRVVTDYNRTTPLSCTFGGTRGEAEDYTFTVVAPPAPTISSLGPPTSACTNGGSITINGTNLTGATAANVKIGGTAVSSITSNSGTVLVAVIGTGTTGTVSVTTIGGTATSAATFTVNTTPAAPVSSAGTAITSTGFTANWATVTGATGYQLDVSTSAIFASFVTGYSNLTVSGTTQAVTGLSPATTYYYRVRATTATCTSVSSSTITVVTACAAQSYASIPYAQNFDGIWINDGCAHSTIDIPDAYWQNTIGGTSPNTNDYWHRSDYAGTDWTSTGTYTPVSQSGTYSARFHNYYAPSASTGSFDLFLDGSTATGTKTLTFYYLNNDPGTSNLTVLVSTDGGATFSSPVLTLGSGVAAWTLETTTIASNSSTIVVRFKATSDYGSTDMGIDNLNIVVPAVPAIFSFSPASECSGSLSVVTITGTNFTGASAVAFNGTAAAFTVMSNTTINATPGLGTTTGTITVTGASTATSSTSFTVNTTPAAPVSSAGTAITSTGFTANWATVTGATGYQLDVSTSAIFASFVTGYSNLTVSGTTQAVTGLSPATTYYYRVRATTATCTSVSSSTITVVTACAAQSYASIPYAQNFDGIWINDGCAHSTIDIPDAYWQNTIGGTSPNTNDYWHRSDYAGTDWTSTGTYTPVSQSGTYSARFHNYYAPSASTGSFDLFLDGSTATGTKTLTFYYLNNDPGTSNLTVLVSTDGGATFSSPVLTLGSGVAAWTLETTTIASNSSTIVVRFKATSDYGSTDMGIDNLNIVAPVTPTITLGSNTLAAGNLTQGTTSNPIYSFSIAPTVASATLSGLTVTTAGTYLSADVTNLKAWYQSSSTFNAGTATLLSTLTTPGVAGLKTFPSFTSQTIANGATGYIFITANVPCAATAGDIISVNAVTGSNTTFASGTVTGTPSAGNNQTIISATPACVTAGAASVANVSTVVTWTAPTGCYSDVLVVVSTASITGTPSGGGYTGNLAYGSGAAFPGGGYVVYEGTSPSQTVTGLTNGTTYYVKFFVRNGTTWSICSQVTVVPALAYCLSGIGGASCTANNGNSLITNVTFNTINNNPGCASVGSDYYVEVPSSTATTVLAQGAPYTMSVTTDAGYNSIVSAWIDYNQNGVYEASEWTQVYTNALTGSATITISNTATLGQTGMRIRSRNAGSPDGSGDACTNFASGIAVDYVVTIVAPCMTLSPSSATICSGGSGIAITASGGTSYTWGPSTGLSSTSGATVTANPTSTTTYTVTPTGTCTVPASVTVTVTAAPTAVTVTTSSPVVCNNGTTVTTLTASGGGGGGNTIVMSQNFDAVIAGNHGLPSGWSTTNNGGWGYDWTNTSYFNSAFNDWNGGANNGYGGTGNCVYFIAGDLTNGTIGSMTTPSMDLSSYTAATLTFYVYNSDATDVLKVYAKQGSGGTYAQVGSTYGTYGNWTQITVSLNAYSGTGFNAVYLQFRGTALGQSSNLAIDNVVVTGTAPPTFTWSPSTSLYTDAAATTAYTGSALTTVYAKPTATQTYTATYTSSGCSATGTSTITVSQPSTAPTGISGTTTICNNGSGTVLTETGGLLGTGATYQWGTGSAIGTSPIGGATSSTLSVTPTVNTTYWVSVTGAAPCGSPAGGASQLVTVGQPSTAPSSINGSSTITVCSGASTTLTEVGGALSAGATYQWGTGSVIGTSPIAVTSSSYTITPTSSGYYWVSVTGTAPCGSPAGGATVYVNLISNQWQGGTAGALTDWNTPTNWCSGYVPSATTDVYIPSGGYQPTIGASSFTAATCRSIVFVGTLTMANLSTLTIASGASFTNVGSFAAGNGTVIFAGSGTISGSTTTFNNLTINGGLTLSSTPVISNNCQINSGGYFNSAPTYGYLSTLIYNTTGTYGVGSEWTGNGTTAGNGIPQNVTILNSTNVTMPSASLSNRGIAGNMNITSGTLTLSTTSGNDLYVAGNWTRNGTSGSFTPNTRAVFLNGSTTQVITVTGVGTETFNYLLINGSGTMQIGSGTTVSVNYSGGLTLGSSNATTIDLNGQTMILYGGGTLSLNGGSRSISSISGIGTFQIQSNTTSIANSGSLVFSSGVIVDLQNILNFGYTGSAGVTTINGTLQIDANGGVPAYSSNPAISGYAPIYGVGSLLKYNTGGSYTVGQEWYENNYTAGMPGIPYNVAITTSSLNFIGQGYPHQMIGNLNINSGGTLSLNATTYAGSYQGDLYIQGNWINAGVFNCNTRLVQFNGSTPSTPQSMTGATTFDYLQINNNSGLTIYNDATVGSKLFLTSGVITTGTNKVIVTSALSTAVFGNSASSYIYGNLRRYVTASGNYDLPVGTVSNYQLANVTFASASLGTTNYLDAKFNSGTPTAPVPSTCIVNNSKIGSVIPVGSWTITPDNQIANPATYTATLYMTNITTGLPSSFVDAKGQTVPPNYQIAIVKRDAGINSGSWTGTGQNGAGIQAYGAHVDANQSNTSNTATVTRSGIPSFSDFAIGVRQRQSYALPVELMYFTAVKTGDDAVLTWATASEINNDHFDVERSADGVTFTKVGKVEGNGNSTQTITYEYTDPSLASYNVAVLYYRLKQVDVDGRYTYSNIASINIDNAEQPFHIISTYPNPFSDHCSVSFYTPVNQTVRVSIYDVRGALVSEGMIDAQTGMNVYSLTDAGHLAGGFYTMNIHAGEQNFGVKMLKTE